MSKKPIANDHQRLGAVTTKENANALILSFIGGTLLAWVNCPVGTIQIVSRYMSTRF
jgi:hypothetical protein